MAIDFFHAAEDEGDCARAGIGGVGNCLVVLMVLLLLFLVGYFFFFDRKGNLG